MEFEGNIWKEGKFWLAEIPFLNAMTQGHSKKEALDMAIDMVFELLDAYFGSHKSIGISLHQENKKSDKFYISGVNEHDVSLLLSLSLRRLREETGLTVRDVCKKLHFQSTRSYSKYEQGKTMPSVYTYDKLIKIIMPSRSHGMRIG